jgi:hypothetical protein
VGCGVLDVDEYRSHTPESLKQRESETRLTTTTTESKSCLVVASCRQLLSCASTTGLKSQAQGAVWVEVDCEAALAVEVK